jgi:2-amino-4-hydroxy-6-hydroxymethyldihydropteridine diphosphokinase
MPEVFVSVGSNTEPRRFLAEGVALMRERFGAIDLSPVYKNSSVGFDGEDFYNLVAVFENDQTPQTLAGDLRLIEDQCQRDRSLPRHAPRTLDLDLLLYGDAVISEKGLEIPRPEILQRSYVLKPLADLRPTMLHPGREQSYGDLWKHFDTGRHPLQRVSLPL